MTNNEMIERYIYAATKLLPEKNRKDIADELRANIGDMLDARCGEVLPTENDVRVVLAEMGTPDELAEKYSSDKVGHLIGGIYYLKWKIVLKVVLICALAGVTLATVMEAFLEHNDLFVTVGDLVSNTTGVAFAAFAFVTIIFAIFERKNVKLAESDSIDKLPSVPDRSNRISKADPIIGIAFGVVFTVLFLGFPQVFPIMINVGKDSFEYIPALDVDSIRAAWLPIIIFAVTGIVRECVQLVEGRYCKSVMISTIVTNAIAIVAAVFWLTDFNIMNSEGIAQIAAATGKNEVVVQLFNNFNLFFLAVVTFALALDTVTTVVKSVRAMKEND